MVSKYPPAHLLGLPVELREHVFHYVTIDRPILHIWNRKNAFHLSATHTPPLALLQTHSTLYHEALDYFYRNHSVTLHVDAFAFACLENSNAYTTALQSNNYLQHTRVLDLRPTLNASIEFLVDAMTLTIPVLLSYSLQLKKVVITWAEARASIVYRNWRPWAYKACALEPLWDLVGRTGIECGGPIMPPPATAQAEEDGMRRQLALITRYEEMCKDGSGEFGERPNISG